MWQNQFSMLINFETIKSRILDIYQQSWYSAINNSSRLETYSLLKHDFIFEPYLDYIKDKRFRIAITRFRTSHDLFIEKGRHLNIERNQRTCNMCTGNMIENEFHFLLSCPAYSELRQKYMKRYYCTWPTIRKFTSLMTSNSKLQLLNTAKLLYFANKIRN